MADGQHLKLLQKNTADWSRWRREHPRVIPDLSRASLAGAGLNGADLSGINLCRADLRQANLAGADLAGAVLKHANLAGADLSRANLGKAKLQEANLAGALLQDALLKETDLSRTRLTGCSIPGLIACDIHLEGAQQMDLVITRAGEPEIVVESIEWAQLVWLMLDKQDICRVSTSHLAQAVLILGRFEERRQNLLDGMRGQLRSRGYAPIFLNLASGSEPDLAAAVNALMQLSWLVIVDCPDPGGIPSSLKMAIMARAMPVQPLIAGRWGWGKDHPDLSRYPWILKPLCYHDQDDLLADFDAAMLQPAVKVDRELARLKERMTDSS